jgi:hypothetical protein
MALGERGGAGGARIQASTTPAHPPYFTMRTDDETKRNAAESQSLIRF